MTTMLMKRLSLGRKEDEPTDQIGEKDVTSRHSRVSATSANSLDEEYGGSASRSVRVKKVADEGTYDDAPEKPPLSRRRVSLFGSSTPPDESLEPSDSLDPKKPSSQRRRSLFGSAPCDEPVEPLDSPEPQKPRSRRRSSLFGSTPSDEPVEPSDSLEPQKPQSRRRSSLFGSTPSDEPVGQSDSLELKKPRSRRRSSLFGSTPPDEPVEPSDSLEPQKPQSRRRRSSLFGSTPSDEPVEPSDSLEPKKPASRRRSLLGCTPLEDELLMMQPPNLEECGKTAPPPRPRRGKKFASNDSSIASGSSHSKSMDSIDNTPSPQKSKGCLATRTKSLDHGPPKPRSQSARRGDRSSGTKNSKENARKASHRRSLTGSDGAKHDQPEKPSSSRRCSLTSDSTHSRDQPEKPKSMRRKSLAEGSAHAAAAAAPHVSVHDVVNRSRTKRGLKEFSRNMLMDTIAKQVAQEMAASAGTKCPTTNYHGNVGQGDSIKNIHQTMMGQKGTARTNILAPHFSEIGIGMSRAKDGSISMCQLFK
jgi:uncharacterized protein YkwD